MNNKDELKYTWILEELLKAGYIELFKYDEGETYAIKVTGDSIKYRRFPFLGFTRQEAVYLPMLSYLIPNDKRSISIKKLLGIVDWEKLKVDTPLTIHNPNGSYNAHFCKYENGKVYVFLNGMTSWTARNTDKNTIYYLPEHSKACLAQQEEVDE